MSNMKDAPGRGLCNLKFGKQANVLVSSEAGVSWFGGIRSGGLAAERVTAVDQFKAIFLVLPCWSL